ncbi:MAG TPA: YbaK/EbsC family protein [Bacillota bacterium]
MHTSDYEKRLLDFISAHQINAEQIRFSTSCHTVEEAAKAANTTPEHLVKNICLLDEEDKLIVAIVKGEDRVSRKRVGKFLASIRSYPADHLPRIATAEEVLEKTGYPCGGVPSFGFSALFLIDPKVMAEATVYTGGGSAYSLVKITPAELLRFHEENHSGQVVRVRD